MHVRVRATAVVAALTLVSVVLAGCGGGADDPVQAVGETAPNAAAEAPTPASAPSDPTTTVAAPPPPPADAPSVVDGLTADEMRAAVDAPASVAATQARRRGPVAEQVAVGGRTLWRITIPGEFELISSEIVVAVGGTDVGVGVAAADLASLVVVTTDAGPLIDGATVSYRWGAAAPTAVGPLTVVR